MNSLYCLFLTEGCGNSEEIRELLAQEWMAKSAIIGIGVSVLSMIILIFAAWYAKRAAEYARDTVNISRSSIYPIVGVSDAFIRKDGFCFFTIQNFGQTPAYNVRVETRSVLSEPFGEPFVHHLGIVDPSNGIPAVIKIDVDAPRIKSQGIPAKIEIQIEYSNRGGTPKWLRKVTYFHAPDVDLSNDRKRLFVFPNTATESESK